MGTSGGGGKTGPHPPLIGQFDTLADVKRGVCWEGGWVGREGTVSHTAFFMGEQAVEI